MPIRIYNSLTKKKEDLVPMDGKVIKMYVCGVTVYDQCHVGHARSLYIFDIMRRYLHYRNYDVRFVRNITDVDDKIINRAKELGRSFDEVVGENIEKYERDRKKLGVEPADVEPRATGYIPQIIEFIEKLMAKGYAYEVQGNVYYQVRKFKDYGRLSGQSINQMVEAARIEQDTKKRDPLDFALWKSAKEGEKSWPSPWGPGRPGWHIECSCMSMHELKTETLDIHAGGRDLIFPHHENEIAQSEALTGRPFARHWIHHGLLTINGQKMAKSLGNFITVEEVLTKYPGDILKFFFLQSHYASPVDFSMEKMEEVKRAYARVNILFNRLQGADVPKDSARPHADCRQKEEFSAAMDDDFNTPKALSAIYDAVNYCNKIMDQGSQSGEIGLGAVAEFLREATGILGINFSLALELSVEDEKILQERAEARRNKDFRKSDELRDLLRQKGIIVEDNKEGQVWRPA